MLRQGDFDRLRECRAGEIMLLAEAAAWLAVARFAILALPFSWVLRGLSLESDGGASPVAGRVEDMPRRIGWAVRATAGRTPWESACLAQALAATAMLRRRGIPSSMAMGVAKSEESGGMTAHAWLICGDAILTGAGGHEKYQVVARYVQHA